MPFLVILKRVEIWLLVALVTGLVIFAFRPEPDIDVTGNPLESGVEELEVAENPDDPAQPLEKKAAVAVKNVTVTPSGEGLIVELTIAGRSTSGNDLTLDESTIRATTSDGENVPLFFEPFSESSLLLASDESLVTLRWWLEKPADALHLQVQGESITADLP
ncbi:MAG: hypothetical protein ABL994_06350 [Verrucomicrobiales bacterium]